MDNKLNKLKKSHELAINFLKFLGKRKPTKEQIKLTEKFFSTAIVQDQIYFNKKLTPREQQSLLLAAKGYTVAETAKILKIKKSTAESHRLHVFKKLLANNMGQAIFSGMRFGQFNKD